MTASEFAFLAMGLVLGLAAGAALLEVIRARPPAPREVRVTMAADAVPRRRAATLADPYTTPGPTEPAPGGPADRREAGPAAMPAGAERRTAVRSGPAPTEGVGEGRAAAAASRPATVPTAIPISQGIDPMIGELRASALAASAAAPTPTARSSARVGVAPAQAAIALMTPPSAMAGGRGGGDATGGATAGGPAERRQGADDDPCGPVRRVAEERCEVAGRARRRATEAEDVQRAAQRAYDAHEARALEAQAAADPRSVRAAKDEAQARFRAARDAASTTDGVEAAARTWLAAVNAINAGAREAAAVLARERAAADALGANLERHATEADAARIAAESAETACLEARQAVAICDERAVAAAAPARRAAAPVPGEPLPVDDADPGADPEADPLAAALAGGAGTPRILRLVRGDRAALADVVAALAGPDADARRRWQSTLGELVQSIVADAIDDSALEFPAGHPFWGPFTVSQARDITRALSSLGYRFDGLGGWLDERVPSQRDLSLALGYAGLDPMRIRHWPDEAEMRGLLADVRVAADEHLAASAGDLTLGEMVSMLGPRADGLAELWNHWGRIRPLLLEEA
ncbi:MAG: hypothetical protein ACLGIJ_01900 [Candidatus Limnocylindria bacterium]